MGEQEDGQALGRRYSPCSRAVTAHPDRAAVPATLPLLKGLDTATPVWRLPPLSGGSLDYHGQVPGTWLPLQFVLRAEGGSSVIEHLSSMKS